MSDSSAEVVEKAPGAEATGTDSQEGAGKTGAAEAKPPEGEGGGNGEPQPPKTALEAAERVMDAAKAKDTNATSEKPQEGSQAKPEGEKLAEDDPDAKLPANVLNHPRFKEVRSENRILKVAKEKNEAAIGELTPKAQNFDQLSGWLRQQQLGAEDFQSMLSIGAAMKNDPAKAYELLKPIVEQLEAFVGVRLPADLQAKVDAGLVDRETASALVKARGAEQMARQRAERATAETEEQRSVREQEERDKETQSVVEGVGAHLKSWEARDPDWARKSAIVLDKVELEFRKLDQDRKQPWTLAEATKVVDDVVKAVNAHFKTFVPAPQAKPGALPLGTSTTGSHAVVPQTSLDAARAALAGMHSG